MMASYSPDYDAATTEIGRDARRIRENKLLEAIYLDFYGRILQEIPPGPFPRVVELGSGGGFFKELAPHVQSSECVSVPGIDRVVDATKIGEAFDAGGLDAICAVNVFHHLPDPAGFLRGVSKVLRPGGRLVLIEPWFTQVGQLFHKIHHEPFVDDPNFWGLVGEGRMTAANTRLPTSVFRDSVERFSREFPELRVLKLEPFHKWLYLLSGGLQLNTHVPRFIARRLVALDRRIATGNPLLGIFALIVVERI